MLYEDFDLRLEPDGPESFRVQACFGEQRASAPMVLPSKLWLVGALGCHPVMTADPRIERISPEEVGGLLFQALLGGEVGRLFNTVQGACHENPNRAFRLRLHFPPREKRAWRLQSLPWELLYRAEDGQFLALSRRMPVVRSLDTIQVLRVLPAATSLRVLIAKANPPGTDELKLAVECKKIEETMARIGIETVVLQQATRQSLRLSLRATPFQIVHFMGHGVAFDEGTRGGALLLHGAGGEVSPLTAALFASLFQDREAPRLVVLNACETATVPDGTDPVQSVAASLVVAGLPAVLAMCAPISDDVALLLAEEFYRRLAQGDPIEAAVTEARLALFQEQPQTNAWAIPVLFVRPSPKDEGNNLTFFPLVASIGSLLPTVSFFMELSPPLLPESKFVPVLAIAAVVIACIWPREHRAGCQSYKQELCRAAAIVLVSLFLVVLYIASYRLTTVSPPVPPPTITCQTGFGLTHLTESAGQFLESHPALANSQDLMLAYAAFAGCRTDLIWERWSISVAGVTLIIILLAASTSWALGFAWLARLLPRPPRQSTRKALLPLFLLLAATFCSCMSDRLSSSHATAAERIKHLEEKAKELDGRNAPGKPPTQPNGETDHANRATAMPSQI